jgi:hypothetical protein
MREEIIKLALTPAGEKIAPVRVEGGSGEFSYSYVFEPGKLVTVSRAEAAARLGGLLAQGLVGEAAAVKAPAGGKKEE